ncbi:hypothetical protein HAX54_005343 [Datura stramonium]|uniref:Uncharacterized protein n=1 Tax=Datura stramonium TaxID=4076 RepID=A0ABS8TA59_DATST|nr:hypothetical protein [Datura stramonium]
MPTRETLMNRRQKPENCTSDYHRRSSRRVSGPHRQPLIMSTSRRNSKGIALMTNAITQNLPDDVAQRSMHISFGLARMEEYYVSFKEKSSIYTETQFEVDSFKNDFLYIYYQIDMRDWGPFTILVDPYFPELVWEFYASYRARLSILRHKGRVDTMPYLPSMLVHGQEVDITPEAINSLYWAEPIQPNSVFRRKVEDKENLFQ